MCMSYITVCWGYNGLGQLGLGNQDSIGVTTGQTGDNWAYVPLGDNFTPYYYYMCTSFVWYICISIINIKILFIIGLMTTIIPISFSIYQLVTSIQYYGKIIDHMHLGY